MTTKIAVFSNESALVLAEEINRFNEEFDGFSTQIFQSNGFTRFWTAFVYYSSQKETIDRNKPPVLFSSPSGSIYIEESIRPTEKQLNFLGKNGIKQNPNLTKKEATLMIKTFMENLQRKNI